MNCRPGRVLVLDQWPLTLHYLNTKYNRDPNPNTNSIISIGLSHGVAGDFNPLVLIMWLISCG